MLRVPAIHSDEDVAIQLPQREKNACFYTQGIFTISRAMDSWW